MRQRVMISTSYSNFIIYFEISVPASWLSFTGPAFSGDRSGCQEIELGCSSIYFNKSCKQQRI